MIVLTATYPYIENGRFDEQHYIDVHIPLTLSVWKEFITGMSVTRGLPCLDGSEPAYRLMAQVYFKSPEALQQAMQCPRMMELADDVANYSDHNAHVVIGACIYN